VGNIIDVRGAQPPGRDDDDAHGCDTKAG
jgi:hypothetical protein